MKTEKENKEELLKSLLKKRREHKMKYVYYNRMIFKLKKELKGKDD